MMLLLKKHLGLKWEFPGGKVDINESNEDALQREIKEELNIIIDVKNKIVCASHFSRRISADLDFLRAFLPGI